MPSRPARLLLPLLLGGLLAGTGARAEDEVFLGIPQHRIDLTQAVPALLDWLINAGTADQPPRTTPRGVTIPPRSATPASEPAPVDAAPAQPAAADPQGPAPATPVAPTDTPSDTELGNASGNTPDSPPDSGPRPAAAPSPAPDQEAQPQPRRKRLGYAFSRPRVLAQQAIFGISHGVALLARACALVPASAAASDAAYAAWNDKNQARIATAERELARYYFAPPLDGVRRLHLVQALQLKTDLGLATDSLELKEACATLPQALQNPRYDLEAVWLLRRDTERLRRATETREILAQCRQQAEPEAVEKIDAALARWEQDNVALETAARERVLADPGNNPATGAQGADSNTKALEHWQEELRQAVRRRFTYAKPDHPTPCAELDEAGAMQGPDYALTRAFDEDKNP